MQGPIAIGGVGGSGTRLVAAIVKAVGYDLGNDLNRAMDHLWFNLLFYRPGLYREEASRRKHDISAGLELQRKHAYGCHRLSPAEIGLISRAAFELKDDKPFSRRHWRWVARRLYRFNRSKAPDRGLHRGWGWKEPVTHLVSRDLLNHFPASKYVHVVRHGLDMSFSENQHQVRRFGSLFGITVPRDEKEIPTQLLRYWIAVNDRAVHELQPDFPSRVLLVNFDRLCADPVPEIRRLVDFLALSETEVDMSALAAMPKIPSTTGRYKNKNLSVFTADELDAVAAHGFTIE